MPERFARLVIMNTGLPTGEEPMGKGFMRWREFAAHQADMPVSTVVFNGVAHDYRYSAGLRQPISRRDL